MSVQAPCARLAALAGLAATLGCSGSQPRAVPAPSTPSIAARLPLGDIGLASPESLGWQLSVGRLEAGRFWLRAHNVNAATTRVVSRSRSTGFARFLRRVETRAVTLLSRDTGATRSSFLERLDQGKRRRVALHYHSGGVRGTLASGTRGWRAHRRASMRPLLPINTETFLLGLRQWRVKRGARLVAAVVAAADLWQLELEAGEARVIEVEIGKRLAREVRGTAIHLSPDGAIDAKATPRRVTLWISEDEFRLPLLVVAETAVGQVRLELVSHQIERPKPTSSPDLPASPR